MSCCELSGSFGWAFAPLGIVLIAFVILFVGRYGDPLSFTRIRLPCIRPMLFHIYHSLSNKGDSGKARSAVLMYRGQCTAVRSAKPASFLSP